MLCYLLFFLNLPFTSIKSSYFVSCFLNLIIDTIPNFDCCFHSFHYLLGSSWFIVVFKSEFHIDWEIFSWSWSNICFRYQAIKLVSYILSIMRFKVQKWNRILNDLWERVIDYPCFSDLEINSCWFSPCSSCWNLHTIVFQLRF